MKNTTIRDPDSAMDRVNLAVAFLVFLSSAAVYFLTVAPTFSFWDSGEFVASAYTLGIPHPPGSPLYIIIARLFSVIPFADDISLRINALSVLSSAGAVGFAYLIIQRLSSHIINAVESIYSRVATYICGAVGAFAMAFGSTFWNNAVEAEVYGLAMLLFFAALWFGIMAFDTKSSSRRVRMLILSIYLAMLGAGVHLIVFLAVPVIGSLFVFRKLANAGPGFLAPIIVVVIAFLAFVTSSRESEIPYNLPLGILLIVFIIHVSSLVKVTSEILLTGLALILANYDSLIHVFENVTRLNLPASLKFAPLGWIGLAALTLWGVWNAYSLRDVARNELQAIMNKSHLDSQKIAVAYAAFSVFAVSATLWLNGYDNFKLALGVGALAVAALFRNRINWRMLVALLSISTIAFGFWPFIFSSALGIICLCAIEWGAKFTGSGLTKLTPVITFAALVLLGWQQGWAGESPLYFSSVLMGLAAISIAKVSRRGKSVWRLAVATLVISIVAYSSLAFSPVRSSADPIINQSDPSRSLAAFEGYIERKQYGRQSMTERMFSRRGEWINQFGVHRRMGFWGFFQKQFGGPGFAFSLILIMGCLGIWELARRSPSLGGAVLILVTLSSVALILYMNFADGTRMTAGGQDYLEVRDRDYFFTPAFAVFGALVGLGSAALVRIFAGFFGSNALLSRAIMVAVLALSIVVPISALARNYARLDRSANYLPYDYGRALLQSAAPDAVIFTGGDNDTFPLWALQSVYRFRRDVAVINLSLGNIDWYLIQARDNWGAPLWKSDAEISALRYVRRKGYTSRIQDQVVDYLLTNKKTHNRPIQFLATTRKRDRKFMGQPVEPRLQRVGMAFDIYDEAPPTNVDTRRTDSLLFKEFQFRGLGRDGVRQDQTTRGMLHGIYNLYQLNARALLREGDSAAAERNFFQAVEYFPDQKHAFEELIDLLVSRNKSAEVIPLIGMAASGSKRGLYRRWAQRENASGASAGAGGGSGNIENALLALKLYYESYPDDKEAFYGYLVVLNEQQSYDELRAILRGWVTRNPGDGQASQMLRALERQLGESQSGGGK